MSSRGPEWPRVNTRWSEKPGVHVLGTEKLKSERLSPDTLEALGIRALNAAKDIHDKLKTRGAWLTSERNQYGEQPIVADVLAERQVIRELARSGIRWHIKSEEHGEIYTEGGKILKDKKDLKRPSEAFAVLDGMDGSTADKSFLQDSKDPLHTRFGTMLALAPTPDPTYGEFAFAGHFEQEFRYENAPDSIIHPRHDSAGRLIYATKGKGTFELTPHVLRRLRVDRNDKLAPGPDTPGYYLEYDYFGGDGAKLEEYARKHGIPLAKLLSTGSHFVDLVTGARIPSFAIAQPLHPDDKPAPDKAPRMRDVAGEIPSQPVAFVAETGRKGMEELAIDFLIGDEAGVVFRTMIDGKPADIRNLKFRTWNQDWFTNRNPQPIIAARSLRVAEELLLAS